MNKQNEQKVLETVDRALRMASDHICGNRDPTLPDYMDSQVARFLDTLKEMKVSLENPDQEWVSRRYMGMAIADGWPFESALGKLICEAEDGYQSLKECKAVRHSEAVGEEREDRQRKAAQDSDLCSGSEDKS